jgi:putative ABC transport system ATP-binding protein
MHIQLNKVVPEFIEPEKIASSEVWNHAIRFEPGERLQIVAPSGRGKTSFLHFLYGLRKDYSGQILYNGKNIHSFDTEDFSGWRQRHVSVIFQDLRLFPEQTVLQNLEVKRQLAPYHPQSKIAEMATRLGIGNKLDKPCKTCSYGEQQRIAIIRALQQPFNFLLLDEPFSHLDEHNRQIAMELMEEEATARGAAIILADLKVITYFNAQRTLSL